MNWLTLYKYLRFGGLRYQCVVCGRGVRKFFPFSHDIQLNAKKHGFAHHFEEMETLNFHQCNCPFCLASDRERLYLIYLDNYFQRHRKPVYQTLDFAPTPAFSKALRKRQGVKYTSADIDRSDVDIRIDICDMAALQDNSFDVIICSHVLEHVQHPKRALAELNRILKADGIAVIMVPIFSTVTETIENESHVTAAERWKHYGQDDHVRLYAKKDFVASLVLADFAIEQLTASQLPDELVKRNAIAHNSVLYICRKSDNR